MPNPQLVEFQNRLVEELQAHYPGTPVQKEWRTMAGQRGLYSPVIDVAVGPFAINERYEPEYDGLMERSRRFIFSLIAAHARNVARNPAVAPEAAFETLRTRNWNARCLLAIEIENEVSRKHLMGGAINAAALGRIGLAVAWNEANLRAFVRLERYLGFLSERGKPTFPTANLLILTKDQLLDAVVQGRQGLVQDAPRPAAEADPLRNAWET